jgi:hypothetical protein
MFTPDSPVDHTPESTQRSTEHATTGEGHILFFWSGQREARLGSYPLTLFLIFSRWLRTPLLQNRAPACNGMKSRNNRTSITYQRRSKVNGQQNHIGTNDVNDLRKHIWQPTQGDDQDPWIDPGATSMYITIALEAKNDRPC